MKIIFSRKGFDSSAGGVPSPLVEGRPVSLPIPTRMPTPTCYRDIGNGIATLVTELTKGRIRADQPCHLDPDLDERALLRLPGWRGALGQVAAAQSHLANNCIGPGDLFLFWGLFRPAHRNGQGSWQFTGRPEHRIFGWLQVGEVLSIGADPEPALSRHPWLASHPHVASGWPSTNTVYVAPDDLALPRIRRRRRGFGVLQTGRRLTSPGSRLASTWTVPSWLNPARGGVGLTYHASERWLDDTTLQAAARGQEFVADIGERADAVAWLARLFDEEG